MQDYEIDSEEGGANLVPSHPKSSQVIPSHPKVYEKDPSHTYAPKAKGPTPRTIQNSCKWWLVCHVEFDACQNTGLLIPRPHTQATRIYSTVERACGAETISLWKKNDRRGPTG